MPELRSGLMNAEPPEGPLPRMSRPVAYNPLAQLAYRQSTGVGTPTISVGAGFWSATITHTALAGKSCQIAVNTANTLITTAGDGEPVCK